MDSFLANEAQPIYTNGHVIWGSLNAVMLAPISEEIYYRGIVFQACRKRFGLLLGLILSSLFFGILHFNPNSASIWHILVGNAAFYGILFSLLFHFSGSLLPAFFSHTLYNVLFMGSSLVLNITK